MFLYQASDTKRNIQKQSQLFGILQIRRQKRKPGQKRSPTKPPFVLLDRNVLAAFQFGDCKPKTTEERPQALRIYNNKFSSAAAAGRCLRGEIEKVAIVSGREVFQLYSRLAEPRARSVADAVATRVSRMSSDRITLSAEAGQ